MARRTALDGPQLVELPGDPGLPQQPGIPEPTPVPHEPPQIPNIPEPTPVPHEPVEPPRIPEPQPPQVPGPGPGGPETGPGQFRTAAVET